MQRLLYKHTLYGKKSVHAFNYNEDITKVFNNKFAVKVVHLHKNLVLVVTIETRPYIIGGVVNTAMPIMVMLLGKIIPGKILLRNVNYALFTGNVELKIVWVR